MTDSWLLKQGYKDADHPGTAHAEGSQWLLTGHNVFKTSWYDGDLDGIVGPKTAQAFHQAKYDIGYADDKLEPTFGPALRDYLTGTLTPTHNMKVRAEQRRHPYVWPTTPRGIVIGWPGQGTHSFRLPPNNWQSDNAWDIAVPIGSTVRAVCDGTIGPRFGPLPNDDPRFQGIRLYVDQSATDSFYYGHLSSTAKGIKPGVRVEQGQPLGKSGVANGVAHLHIATKRLFPLIKQAV